MEVRIRGPRLLLRPVRPDEIEAGWQAVVASDPIAIAELPRSILVQSPAAAIGALENGWLMYRITRQQWQAGSRRPVQVARYADVLPPGRSMTASGPGNTRPV